MTFGKVIRLNSVSNIFKLCECKFVSIHSNTSRHMLFRRTKIILLNRRTRIQHVVKKYYSNTKESETFVANFSNGRKLEISSGKYARFSDGSAVCKMGDSAVLVTAVSKNKPGTANFLPLTVDYRQKFAASGQIPTNFLKRELGPSEREILSARLVDRSVRPLFDHKFRCETQLVCNMLAVDHMYSPDILAVNAASAALSVSNIPWNGPIGAVRVGLCDNEVIINPTRRELLSSDLDMVVTATKQNMVVMIEGKGNIVLLQDFLKAIKVATKEAQHIINAIEKLQKSCGITKRSEEDMPKCSIEVGEAVRSMSEMQLKEIFRNDDHDKLSRDNAVNEVRNEVVKRVWSSYPDEEASLINDEFSKVSKEVFRDLIFEDNRRCDGRTLDELRKINCQIDMYKPLHGSAMFQRGQTQVLCTVALDSPENALRLDSVAALESGMKSKNFFLHYEFPPYATGEIGRVGPLGRRELGHGALAEKGLVPSLPNNFPYTVRLTSEVLESNGSSSMATVCGGTLALLDAGVPLVAPVAGVAIGLVTKYKDNDTKHMEDYRILTDLLGIEDYMGDMDMKVAGTRKGITAIQTDIKLPGIPLKIVMESMQKAVDAKAKILDILQATIGSPRKVKKDCWPVTETMTIEPHQRSKLIGSGGSNIKKILFQTGAQVTAEESSFSIFAPSQEAMIEAKVLIEELLKSDHIPNLEFGGIYTAKITELKEIGVLVTLYPTMTPSLLHNSQLDQRKVAHPSALGLEVGQEIQVKYFGRDPVSGFMRLSRKVLQGPAISVVRNLDKSGSTNHVQNEENKN